MRAASPQTGPELPVDPQPEPLAALVDDEPAAPVAPPADDLPAPAYGPDPPLAVQTRAAPARAARPMAVPPPLPPQPSAMAMALAAIPTLRGCPNPPARFFAQLHIEHGRATIDKIDGLDFNPTLSWQACARRVLEAVQYPRVVGSSTLRVNFILAP
jgi:hypothetical protein